MLVSSQTDDLWLCLCGLYTPYCRTSVLFFLIYLFVDLFNYFVVARTAGFVCLFVVGVGGGGVLCAFILLPKFCGKL